MTTKASVEPITVTDLWHLSALVAEHVMGWSVCPNEDCEGCDHQVLSLPDGRGGVVVQRPLDAELWHPAEDIAAAWEVVERMHDYERQFHVQIRSVAGGKQWWCAFAGNSATNSRRSSCATAGAAPVAICLAALEAVGVSVTLPEGGLR